MKLYRYMSIREFTKMDSFCEIEGHSHNARTSSEGVCFLGGSTDVDGVQYTPENCYAFLEGIVSGDILVEFETDETVSESTGVYCNPSTWETMSIIEYCVPSYSRNTFIPKRYCIPDEWNRFNLGTWYNYN